MTPLTTTAILAVVELLDACTEGTFYEDYDESTRMLGDARNAVDHLIETMRLGSADWLYDAELDMHVPCCSQHRLLGALILKCHNGPLTGNQIHSGNCGGH